MTKRRVVITGLGMLAPLGLSVPETWHGILQGQSGIDFITNYDASNLPVRFAGQVKGFDPSKYFPLKEIKKLDPFSQYGIAASDEAIQDAGLVLSDEDRTRIGVAVGSGIGGITTIIESHDRYLEGGSRRVSPFFIPAAIINMAAGQISIRHGLQGPNISIVSACTTGAHNIGIAARMIANDEADVMVAGGTEMATGPLCIAGFASARALSDRNDDPKKASRPWDKNRDGFVLSEGAGILIMESLEHAQKRGARIYAELVGFGMSADAYHITSPDETGQGFVHAMQNALKDARLAPTDVDYINAHGTSTPAGDRIEAAAIKKCFGDHAYDLAVSSTKSMIGHLLGAAGAVESIFSVLAIRDQVAPPTVNLEEPDEGCDLNFVPNEAQPRKIETALSNSFGFGGTNASLIFKRYA